MTQKADERYERAFREMIKRNENVRLWEAPGREFLYRPGQLLVAKRDTGRVRDRLRETGYAPRPGRGFSGVDRLLLDQDAEIPTIVSDLRDLRRWKPDDRLPAVQPHHVLVGFGNIMGNPTTPPTLAAPLPDPDPYQIKEGSGVLVGVCDTGIWTEAPAYHPAWLGPGYTVEAGDDDALYTSGDQLALQGGHGTFVAGVLRQAAPGVAFDPEVALDPSGLGDEETVANALRKLDNKVSIINMSLGGFTQDNLAPLPLADALAKLDPAIVVVASAGNAGTNRPSWPAAFARVIAVAAVERQGTQVVPADYSNYGPWVDASATGEWVSTFVKGQLVLPGTEGLDFGGFAQWSGTSFAAPYVAGRLAAAMTAGGISAAQARADLLSNPKWHPDYGVLVS